MNTIRKCQHLMLGIAIGDAFGAGYETLSRHQVRKRLNLKQYHPFPLDSGHQAGHYTDDTQMSIAVAKTLYDTHFTPINLASAFLSEYKSNKIIGYSKDSLSLLENSKSPEDFITQVVHTPRNGATMRAVPIGVLPDIKTVLEYSVINAQVTHNEDSAVVSSAAIALASHYFFHGIGQPTEVFDFCLDHLKGLDKTSLEYLVKVSTMKELIPEILFGEDYRDHGVPIHGLKTAGSVLFILARYSVNAMELLKQAILLGGDTDTTASIALGIAQSRGEGALDNFLLDGLQHDDHGIDYIQTIGTRLASILPMEVRNIKRLNYPGQRQSMITQSLDGLIETLDPIYLAQIMKRLFSHVEYKPDDIILAIDASGYIPAVAASMISGLKLGASKKADLDFPNKIMFYEADTPNPYIFIYSLPPHSRIILVDDEINSGNTLLHVVQSLRGNGHHVVAAVVPVESTRHNAKEKLKDIGVPLISHTTHDLQ